MKMKPEDIKGNDLCNPGYICQGELMVCCSAYIDPGQDIEEWLQEHEECTCPGLKNCCFQVGDEK